MKFLLSFFSMPQSRPLKLSDKAFMDKYGLDKKQLKYVRDFAKEKGFTLAKAAKELNLEAEG